MMMIVIMMMIMMIMTSSSQVPGSASMSPVPRPSSHAHSSRRASVTSCIHRCYFTSHFTLTLRSIVTKYYSTWSLHTQVILNTDTAQCCD